MAVMKNNHIFTIVATFLNIGMNCAEEPENGSGDIEETTYFEATTGVDEDADSAVTKTQIIFIASICSILSAVLVTILFMFLCGKKKTHSRCYGPVTLLPESNFSSNDEDDTLYMVDYDQVSMNHSKLAISVNSELNE